MCLAVSITNRKLQKILEVGLLITLNGIGHVSMTIGVKKHTTIHYDIKEHYILCVVNVIPIWL
jgi:hypothetical protein